MSAQISVVVPIYNVEKYLRKCLDSIVGQTYKNLEVILVDDGSTDTSGKIADEYAERDKRITVIHKENGGLSDARNAGIEIATGTFITFIDSDDYIDREMIDVLHNCAEGFTADFVTCRRIKFTDESIPEEKNSGHIQYHVIDHKNQMREFLRGEEFSTTAWGKLYKTSLFNEIRYPFGRLHEDVFTTYKLVHIAQKIVCTSFYGYYYRMNEKSITHSAFSVRTLDAIEGKIQLRDFLNEHYPDLIWYGNQGIIYAVNKCYYSMCRADYHDKALETKLHEYYCQYWYFYLFGKNSVQGKLFMLCALINMEFARFSLYIFRL